MLSRIGLSLLLAVLGAFGADAGTFTSFKVPGAKDTAATAVNASGTVAGYYRVQGQKQAGFLRAPDGTLTTFSAPGLKSTIPEAINDGGAVAGYSGEELSFLRKPDGSFEIFQVAGARYTTATAVNAAGFVSGTFLNPDHSSGSFLRAPDGTIAIVSASAEEATSVYALNDGGVMVGQLGFGASPQGFLLFPDQSVRTLGPGTSVSAINNHGWAAGVLFDDGPPARGFTLKPHGRIKPFGPRVDDMEIAQIDSADNVAGTYLDRHSIFRGFVYSRTGTFTKIDAPDAGRRQPFAGTKVRGMNGSGTVVGAYLRNNYRSTAFIWMP